MEINHKNCNFVKFFKKRRCLHYNVLKGKIKGISIHYISKLFRFLAFFAAITCIEIFISVFSLITNMNTNHYALHRKKRRSSPAEHACCQESVLVGCDPGPRPTRTESSATTEIPQNSKCLFWSQLHICVEDRIFKTRTATVFIAWQAELTWKIDIQSLIYNKSVPKQNLAFVSYWYRNKCLQMHF